MQENDRRITGLNQSIHDEEVSLEHRKQMASDALHDKDFGKAPKGRVGRFMEAAGNISSNAWESIQARTGSMDEVFTSSQILLENSDFSLCCHWCIHSQVELGSEGGEVELARGTTLNSRAKPPFL
jgi:hypothetical protein